MNLVWGMVIGFLIGIALCYAKEIKKVYDNKDKIAAASELGTAFGNFRDAFKF